MRIVLTRFIAFYLRHSSISVARWRLVSLALKNIRSLGLRMGTVTVTTRFGSRMTLNLGDWVDQYIYVTGNYEDMTASVISACLGEGDSGVDIGANIGFFSLLMGVRVGRTGAVWAFEPIPDTNRRLRENVSLNPGLNITVRNEAIADEDGERAMFGGTTDHSGIASLRPIEGSTGSHSVPVRRLTTVLPPATKPALVKIDVEGAEFMVLQGMRDLLASHRPDIVIEMSAHFLVEMGSSASQVDEHLRSLGYRLYVIDWDGLLPIHAWHDGLPQQCNALYTVRESLPSQLPVKQRTV